MITDYDGEYVEEISLSRIALGHNNSSGPCEMTFDYQYVLSLIAPPSTVTHRHVQIDNVWKFGPVTNTARRIYICMTIL